MRGAEYEQSSMFSYISAERRVPKDHPLRAIRTMVDAALKELGRASRACTRRWGGLRYAGAAAARAVTAGLVHGSLRDTNCRDEVHSALAEIYNFFTRCKKQP